MDTVSVERASSVLDVKVSQSAFLKFHLGTGLDEKAQANGGVVINIGRCWDRGKRSRISLVEVTPAILVAKVTSGLVPLFHLPEKKDGGCFGL